MRSYVDNLSNQSELLDSCCEQPVQLLVDNPVVQSYSKLSCSSDSAVYSGNDIASIYVRNCDKLDTSIIHSENLHGELEYMTPYIDNVFIDCIKNNREELGNIIFKYCIKFLVNHTERSGPSNLFERLCWYMHHDICKNIIYINFDLFLNALPVIFMNYQHAPCYSATIANYLDDKYALSILNVLLTKIRTKIIANKIFCMMKADLIYKFINLSPNLYYILKSHLYALQLYWLCMNNSSNVYNSRIISEMKQYFCVTQSYITQNLTLLNNIMKEAIQTRSISLKLLYKFYTISIETGLNRYIEQDTIKLLKLQIMYDPTWSVFQRSIILNDIIYDYGIEHIYCETIVTITGVLKKYLELLYRLHQETQPHIIIKVKRTLKLLSILTDIKVYYIDK